MLTNNLMVVVIMLDNVNFITAFVYNGVSSVTIICMVTLLALQVLVLLLHK